jgi:hypothetical protein
MTTHNSMHAHAPAGATQLSKCETVKLRDVELRGTTVATLMRDAAGSSETSVHIYLTNQKSIMFTVSAYFKMTRKCILYEIG